MFSFHIITETLPIYTPGGFKLKSIDIVHNSGGGIFNDLGVLEHVAVGLQELGIIMTVADTLVRDQLEINVLFLLHLAAAVDLVLYILGAKGDEHGQSAEVIDVVVDGPDAQGAQVGDDHGAVEGAGLNQRFGQDAKVVTDAQQLKGKAQQETGSLTQSLSHVLGVIVAVVSLDLFNLLVELAVNIKDGVGGLEVDLDGGLGGINGQAALDSHDNSDIIGSVDTATGHKAVQTGQHGYAADMYGDEKMQQTNALVALNAQFTQALIQSAYLKALLIVVTGIVAGGHDIGNETVERGEGTDQATVLSVAKAALI